MDREQEEMQLLGFCGIIKESIKLIFTWRKIFSQITLALLLPVSFIALAYTEISRFPMAKIQHDQRELDHAKAGTPKYKMLSNLVTSDIIELSLPAVAYWILALIFYLLSKSTVVYTIACVYTSRPITFGRAMSIIPKVWKRLVVTYLWGFLASVIYTVCIVVPFIICFLLLGLLHSPAVKLILGFTLGFIFLILYLFGSVYIEVISDLAGVTSVLEDIYGIQAMFKSMNLVKGKMGISIAISLLLMIVSMATYFMADGYEFGFLRFGVAALYSLFGPMLTLVGLVTQTVIYFVCKSYHDENINKLALLLEEYVPLQADEVDV